MKAFATEHSVDSNQMQMIVEKSTHERQQRSAAPASLTKKGGLKVKRVKQSVDRVSSQERILAKPEHINIRESKSNMRQSRQQILLHQQPLPNRGPFDRGSSIFESNGKVEVDDFQINNIGEQYRDQTILA